MDESRTFEAGQPPIVEGVTVRHASIAESSAALQRTMSALVPEVRWLLRATPPKPTWAQEQLREDVSRVDAWRGGRP